MARHDQLYQRYFEDQLESSQSSYLEQSFLSQPFETRLISAQKAFQNQENSCLIVDNLFYDFGYEG